MGPPHMWIDFVYLAAEDEGHYRLEPGVYCVDGWPSQSSMSNTPIGLKPASQPMYRNVRLDLVLSRAWTYYDLFVWARACIVPTGWSSEPFLSSAFSRSLF
jgi:hypothetical protein